MHFGQTNCTNKLRPSIRNPEIVTLKISLFTPIRLFKKIKIKRSPLFLKDYQIRILKDPRNHENHLYRQKLCGAH